MNLSSREKTLAVLAVYALVLFLFIRFVYLPQQTLLKILQTENQQLAQGKMHLEAIMQKQGQRDLTNEENELLAVNEQLPAREEMIRVIKYLNDSMQKCNVELVSLEYQGSINNEEEVRPLTFAVETSGSMFNLIDFLQQLVMAPRLINAAEVTLNARQMGKTNVTIDEDTSINFAPPPGMSGNEMEGEKAEGESAYPDREASLRAVDRLVPDQFDMRVIIYAYYLADQPVNTTENYSTAVTDNAPEAAEEVKKSGFQAKRQDKQ